MGKRRARRGWDIPLYAVSPLVLAAGGALALVVSIGDLDHTDTLAGRGVRTTATVTAQDPLCGVGCAADVSYTFTTPDGVRHAGSEGSHERVGPTVDVWYDPQRPDDVSTMHEPDHVKGVVMVVLASVLILVGIGLTTWLVWAAQR